MSIEGSDIQNRLRGNKLGKKYEKHRKSNKRDNRTQTIKITKEEKKIGINMKKKKKQIQN